MIIRLGYELAYEFRQPTPMILILGIHSSRVADILIQDNMTTTPSVNVRGFWDAYGNWCSRIIAPQGGIVVSTDALIRDPGLPEPLVTVGRQWAVEELPDEILMYLLGSRYCESDLLNEIAWDLFEQKAAGLERVTAICDYVHGNVTCAYEYAQSTRTAFDTFEEGKGVGRDAAHLAIAFCRCMNIPTRYCTGYLADADMVPAGSPNDFCAWMEAYIDGRWHMFDPQHNVPRAGRVLIARGRDAADVSICSTFGPAALKKFKVWAMEVDYSAINEFEEGYLKHQLVRQPCLEFEN